MTLRVFDLPQDEPGWKPPISSTFHHSDRSRTLDRHWAWHGRNLAAAAATSHATRSSYGCTGLTGLRRSASDDDGRQKRHEEGRKSDLERQKSGRYLLKSSGKILLFAESCVMNLFRVLNSTMAKGLPFPPPAPPSPCRAPVYYAPKCYVVSSPPPSRCCRPHSTSPQYRGPFTALL